MTRQEFEDIGSWWELIDFCQDYECSYCDDVYSEGSRDNYIDDDLEYMAENNGWMTIRDILNDIPTGYEYYHRKDGEWFGLDDDDLEDYKTDILEWGDINDIWDEEEEEEGEPWYAETDDFVPPEETMSISDLMSACNSKLQKISDDAEKEAVEDE